MKRMIVLAAALAMSTSAHAVGYQIRNGMIDLDRPKALDIFNLNWEFANDPNWGYEVFDCSLKGFVLASFQAWQTGHLSPAPPLTPLIAIIPPVIDPPPMIPPVIDPPVIPVCLDCDPPPVRPVVPETSTWLMILVGFAAMGALRLSQFRIPK